MKFQIESRESRARAGRLATSRGEVETPAFMPVATLGAVKTLTPDAVRAMGYRMILSNTYHLHLRPGEALINRLGGLHRFMGWEGPILTDSGGYQVFSLAKRMSLDDGGVAFRSPVDGAEVRLTPESVIGIQRALGSDLVMPLDQPAAPGEDAAAAMRRSLAWLDRSIREPLDETQTLFAIVQGGFDRALRKACVEECASRGLKGLAVGGLSVGETDEAFLEIADETASHLPDAVPRYLMGVGSPADIARSVAMGYDLFDCVLPTRLGRTGWAFTSEGVLKLKNARFAEDARPLDEACVCLACRKFSRAYLRHCFKVGEILGPTLASHHNLHAYARWMEEIRGAIRAGSFGAFLRRVTDRWGDARMPAVGEEEQA